MPKPFLVTCWLLLLISPQCIAATVNSIIICVPQWDYYTEKDGTGLYHELWNKVYTRNNITVEVKYIPFKRCERTFTDTKTTKYDVFVGGYGEEGQIIPRWHIGIDLLSAAYRKGYIDQWAGEKSLAGKRVSWERGYDYDKYGVVKVDVLLREFSKLEQALQMLHKNRTDFILDYPKPLKELTKKQGLSDQITIVPNAIIGPKYHMIFSNTEKGRALASIWDSGMERLHQSGELQKMYAAYEDEAY